MSDSTRNPSWTRDELLVALDYYLDHPDDYFSPKSAGLLNLTSKIGRVAKAIGLSGSDTLRNANGVSMKLLNFRAHDPHHDTKGLSRGNKLESVIWAEFSGNHPVLKQVVAAILDMASVAKSDDTPILLDDFTEAQEGRLLTRLHSYRERSVSIVRQKKKDYRKKHGHLRCEACGFDFQATYGERGEDFIECHHTKPLSQLVVGETTSLAELVLLCANCHRMIHAARPWWTIAELQAAIT